MKKDLLKYYVRDRLQAVQKDLRLYKKKPQPELLHHIRVEIKKIRAVIAFVKRTSSEAIGTGLLKPLFRKAGKIRELLIHIDTFKADKRYPARLLSQLKQREHLLENEFTQNIKEYSAHVKQFQRELELPEKLPSEGKIKKYFRKEVKKAIRELQEKDRTILHDFRKRIKVIMYTYHLLPGKLRSSVKINADFVDGLQKRAGDWHDTFTVIDFLKRSKVPGLKAYLLQLQKREKDHYNNLLALNASAKDFFL